VGEKVMFRHKNHKIAPVNAEIEKICTEKGVTYIDLYSKFTASDGYLEPSFTNDNLHLMGKGYLHWIEIIRPYIYE
jgi:lysophospholipase L1-like esterase